MKRKKQREEALQALVKLQEYPDIYKHLGIDQTEFIELEKILGQGSDSERFDELDQAYGSLITAKNLTERIVKYLTDIYLDCYPHGIN